MSEPAKSMVPPRGMMSVKRLLETDLCPCKSEKPFGECCRGEPKEGLTPENTLHLLFEERDPTDSREDPLIFYAVLSQKMDGKVLPDTIVESIAKRLHSPPVARALDRLTWKARNSKGLTMSMQVDPEVAQHGGVIAPKKELLDAQGEPVKP